MLLLTESRNAHLMWRKKKSPLTLKTLLINPSLTGLFLSDG